MTARVVKIEDGSIFTDKRQRVTFRVAEADRMENTFTIPVDEGHGWQLGQLVTLRLEMQ